MEGDNNNVAMDISVSGGAAAAAAGAGYSRWNPTKEQIDMLEGLYKQGIRTPSAEQIQQITTRLRAFGHIEGKNVFYWFQNHKARQRQKQKQDTISYFNRFLHHHKTTSSVFPPCPNNVCSPFCIPYTDLALSHHHHHQQQQQPKVLLPRAIKRKPLQPEKMKVTAAAEATNINIPSGSTTGAIFKDVVGYVNINEEYCSSNKQTLDLFPLQPTCNLLQARTSSSSRPSIASVSSGNIPSTPETSSSSDNKCIVDQQGSGSTSSGGKDHVCFFDFFCESH